MRSMFFLLFALAALAAAEQYQRLLLRDVQTLTFKGGQYTVARRVSPIPQLHCVSGECQAAPRVIQCKNQGHDGRDYQWKCEAELPVGFQLGVTDVSCEGFDYPEDSFILAGSCGLEYTIERTAGTQPRFPPPPPPVHNHYQQPPPPVYTSSSSAEYPAESKEGVSLFYILFVGLFAFCILRACCSSSTPAAAPGPAAPRGPGFDGGSFGPGGRGYPGGGSGGDACPPPASNSGPGFWTGAAVGGLAAHLLTRDRTRPQTTAPPSYHSATATTHTTYAPPPSYSSTNAPSDSGATHVSSGYGTTKRR